MKYLNIYIILFSISTLLAQNKAGSFSLISQLPQGEVKNQEVPAGFGFDINAIYYPVKELGFGLNAGYSMYGYSERQIPFNYYTDLVYVTEKTTNSIAYGHMFFRVVPFQSNIKPYIEGILGFKNLFTNTEVVNENCNNDDNDNCQIADKTNATDYAFSYGYGGGLEIKLTNLRDENDIPSGEVSFFMNVRYLMGAKAKYLKKGSISFSDPQDGPVATSFDWNESKTDILQIAIGVSLSF